METIKIVFFEYILGFALQSFAIILGIYVFNRQKVILKEYIVTSSIMTIISLLVRLLPITIGVHTILNMLFIYLICVLLLKMPAYTTIRSSLMCIVLVLICEMIVTTIMMAFIGKEQFEKYIENSMQRSYVGVLANIIFAVIVIFSYLIVKKKGDSHRSISS